MIRLKLLFLLVPYLSISQTTSKRIFTQDVNNFWIAYDSIRTTKDSVKQIAFINDLYIKKASDGLKAFMRNKSSLDAQWIKLINGDPIFWDSIRPKTLMVKTRLEEVEQHINYLNHLYPDLKEANTYFIIGIRQQGGTVRNTLSIIGTEVISENDDTNFSALVHLVVHEYVHTQQVKPDFQNINVLTSAIREGACDFIAELVAKQTYNADYIHYGKKHEALLWKVFKNDMLSHANDWWVSTGDNPVLPSRDLGYFVGYAICRSFYQKATDKKEAIKQIVEIDYSDQKAVQDFLKKSGYEDYVLKNGFSASKTLETEGYTSTKDKVVFQFNTRERTIVIEVDGSSQIYDDKKLGAINTISVAGDFNSWATKDTAYNLLPQGNGQYTLSVDKARLGKAGEKAKFKFLINNKHWVVPNFAISNRITNKDGTTDLFMQL